MNLLIMCVASAAFAVPAVAATVSPNDPVAIPETGGQLEWSSFGSDLRDAGDCDCIDLVFVIDDTGSMNGAIANVAAGISDILDLAETTCGSVQTALVTFKDDVEVDVPMTFNTALVSAAIAGLVGTGGAGEPEASDEALREVFTATACALTGDFDPSDFRPECCKVAIIVTDARPAGCDDAYTTGVDDVAAHARALDAVTLGVQIGALFVPTFGDPTGDIVPVMTDYAATTGGVLGVTDASGAGTADAIEQVVLNCIGGGRTELCCIDGVNCVQVLEGQCDTLGGVLVDSCVTCGATPIETMAWGQIKSNF